jgi:hypothetical protein
MCVRAQVKKRDTKLLITCNMTSTDGAMSTREYGMVWITRGQPWYVGPMMITDQRDDFEDLKRCQAPRRRWTMDLDR